MVKRSRAALRMREMSASGALRPAVPPRPPLMPRSRMMRIIPVARSAFINSASASGNPASRNGLSLPPRSGRIRRSSQLLLQALDPLVHHVDLLPGHLDAAPRFLLERVEHPYIRVELHGIDRP